MRLFKTIKIRIFSLGNDVLDHSVTLYNIHEVTEVYVNAFQRIAREVKFDQLSIYYRKANNELQVFKGVSIYQYMIMNSQEIKNFGYSCSEDTETVEQDDSNLKHVKEINYNFFPSSVTKN